MTAPVTRASPDGRILREIEQVVRTYLDRDVELTPDQKLVEALELDSLKRLTLVIEIENHFRICLEEQDEDAIVTVGDLVSVIRGRLS